MDVSSGFFYEKAVEKRYQIIMGSEVSTGNILRLLVN